jgi:mRNA-degrading endonuclease RelE of RelBE toxin-antitoxin system
MGSKEMAQRKEWLAWIDPADPSQHEWAYTYLDDKGLLRVTDSPFSAVMTTYGSLMGTASVWPENEQTKDLIKRMKGAWAQEKFRRARYGKKGYNYVLSKKARRTLERLAEETQAPITETLEILLDDVSSQLEIQKARFQKSQVKMAEKHTKLKADRDQTRKAAMEIWAQLDSCLLEMSKLTLSMTSFALKDLSEDQRGQLEKQYRETRKGVVERLPNARLRGLIGQAAVFDLAPPSEEDATPL